MEDKHTHRELIGFTKCFSSLQLRDWETQYEMNTAVEKKYFCMQGAESLEKRTKPNKERTNP